MKDRVKLANYAHKQILISKLEYLTVTAEQTNDGLQMSASINRSQVSILLASAMFAFIKEPKPSHAEQNDT